MTNRNIASELLSAVGGLSSQLRLRFAAGGPPDVGFVALASLRHLTRSGPTTITTLARADDVTTQAISLRIRPLVEAGLATRAADDSDGRKTLVSATPEGKDAVTAAEAGSLDALARAFARLEVSEVTALSAAIPALLRLTKLLEEDGR
jgi:DNA-binding MarR family transcriptional regulator